MDKIINEINNFGKTLLLKIADMDISEDEKINKINTLYKTLMEINVLEDEDKFIDSEESRVHLLNWIGDRYSVAVEKVLPYSHPSQIKRLIDDGYLEDTIAIVTSGTPPPAYKVTKTGYDYVIQYNRSQESDKEYYNHEKYGKIRTLEYIGIGKAIVMTNVHKEIKLMHIVALIEDGYVEKMYKATNEGPKASIRITFHGVMALINGDHQEGLYCPRKSEWWCDDSRYAGFSSIVKNMPTNRLDGFYVQDIHKHDLPDMYWLLVEGYFTFKDNPNALGIKDKAIYLTDKGHRQALLTLD